MTEETTVEAERLTAAALTDIRSGEQDTAGVDRLRSIERAVLASQLQLIAEFMSSSELRISSRVGRIVVAPERRPKTDGAGFVCFRATVRTKACGHRLVCLGAAV